ncbi:hypothetical protein [Paenibacillus phocaensis]|uniref:hypothetical protein n=1 Tax=Paenibacillus phocaensis TaxID=1776378 RepID=UPI000839D720|nr:hypothetical protein [Paenibacillus phocaensis]
MYKTILEEQNLHELKEQLIQIIKSTGTEINENQIMILDRGVPHKTSTLPKDRMAIYSFIYQDRFLKIGKAGPSSNARFNSQHYDPKSSQSNLAKSLLADPKLIELNLDVTTIKEWIKTNTRRIDFLIDATLGIFVLNLIEAFLHLKYRPKYEGFEKQRLNIKEDL